MISINDTNLLKFTEKHNPRLKHGETVTISVIKRLVGDKWAVGIGGRVLPVISEIQLVPGQKMKAQVIRQADKTMLKLAKNDTARITDFLVKNNLPDDALTRTIVSSLLKTGMALSPELIRKMRQTLSGMKGDPEKNARLLAVLQNKKIDITSPGIDGLFTLLRYGDDSGNREKKQKKDREKEQKQDSGTEEIGKELKKSISGQDGVQPGLLSLFNHINAENENWIVLPFHSGPETEKLKGTIRFLYKITAGKIMKTTISINQDNGICWFFHISEEKGSRNMKIFCNNEEKRAAADGEISKLAIKLQNTGIKIDDIIYRAEDFDGFTPFEEAEQYREINMVF